MVAVTTYRVSAERTGKWWVLQAIDAPGAITQVARLDQAEQIIEAIAFVTGRPQSEIEIDVEPTLPAFVVEQLGRVQRLREESDRARALAAAEWKSLARPRERCRCRAP